MEKNNEEDRRARGQRLPKYRRQPTLYGNIRLTARDLDILALAERYRYMTVDHVHALVEGGARQLSRRLQALFHHGLLTRYIPLRRLRVGLDTGSRKMIYGLDRKGWLALKQAGFGGPGEWRADRTRRAEWFIEHQTALATLRGCLEVAIRARRDLRLLDWRQGEEIAGEFRYENVQSGEWVATRVVPDAYFAVLEGDSGEMDVAAELHRKIGEELKRGKAVARAKADVFDAPAFCETIKPRLARELGLGVVDVERLLKTRRNFLVEVDMGSMEMPRLREKFQRLYNYARSSSYGQAYAGTNENDLRILVLAKFATGGTRLPGESEPRSRLERMMETLTQIRGKRSGLARFWFARLPDPARSSETESSYGWARPELLLGPIWRRWSQADERGGRQVEFASLFGKGPGVTVEEPVLKER